MTARLRTHVHVRDDDGVFHVFGPHDQVPEWAVKAIENPKAWAIEPDRPEPEQVPEKIADPNSEGNTSEKVIHDGTAPEPPRHGAGSSTKAWREYALGTGWFDEIAEDTSRELIIAAVDDQRATGATKE